MSGRQRDLGRTYASGSSKRKAKEDKERREHEETKKMKKMTDFFSNSENTNVQESSSLQSTLMLSSPSTSASYEDTEISASNAAAEQ